MKQSTIAKFVLILSIFTAITGCATVGKFEEHLQENVGQDISSVIQASGPPHQTYQMPNGNTMYSWMYQGNTSSRVVETFGGPQLVTSTAFCKTTYTANAQNKIVSWQHEGNMCKSR